MAEIKLPNGVYNYDPDNKLGPDGGFGAVYHGKDENDNDIAVKKIHIDASEVAHRELRIAEELTTNSYNNVIPILDSGQDAESDGYFVIMPIAEKSLQGHIDNNQIDLKEAVNIILQVVDGLLEVPELVHRDLKPGNILYHEGVWKIADFGIARFVEESTSLNTLEECLTPLYAAPEQWNLEKSTKATDIYALGCISYLLTTGSLPFFASSREEYKNMHLNEKPPNMDIDNGLLSNIISQMLRKSPDVRPSTERVKAVLQTVLDKIDNSEDNNAIKVLEQAAATAAERDAEREAKFKIALRKVNTRRKTASEAYEMLQEIVDQLFDKILAAAPNAKRSDNTVSIDNEDITVTLNTYGDVISEDAFDNIDIVAGAFIAVRQHKPTYIWGSSLWYIKTGSDYRWCEASYWENRLGRQSIDHSYEPFAADDLEVAIDAASPAVSVYDYAFGPVAIDNEQLDDFNQRWCSLFAKAIEGELSRPSQLPLHNVKNWY